MYNRERFISRALDSCLKQYFNDFEIIVVDDGSQDKSKEVVQQYSVSRVKLICHNNNRGLCFARQTGVDVARGEWVIFLDSDDELSPGSLNIIHRKAKKVKDHISGLRFMCQLDSGYLSPSPPFLEEVWDYKQYILFLESYIDKRSESIFMARRWTFNKVRFPKIPRGQGVYHLDFAKLYPIATFPEVVRYYHQDADNQNTTLSFSHILKSSSFLIERQELILKRHGKSLAQWAPRKYIQTLTGLATANFLAGRRKQGFHHAMLSLRTSPEAKTWVVLLAGLVNPKLLARIKHFQHMRNLEKLKLLNTES